MSDNNLRLQVILNAVDKLTRPFRSAQASSRELAAAVKKSRDAIKQLDQAGSSLDSFRKLQAENQKLGDRLSYARQRANLLSQELGAMGPPSQRQVVALGRQRLAVQRLEERQKKLQQQTALVRAELYRAGISANDGASATARITRETMRYNRQLSEQEARLRRVGEQQRKMHAARGAYARRLEVRDRIAGAGATTTAAGLAMGAPVMAAVKSYTSMEDAMKGVAKQVNGLRDDNGNRTARFYEMQDAIKAASEQLPMENGAVDFAALVEGGARMNVANPDDSWEDQKRDLLAFASTAAKAATAFELPADELSESLGKIAQLYKIPTRNIEQLGDALNYLDDNAMSKGADIIDVMQRLGGVADRLDYRKAAALGSTFLTLGAAPEVAASAANAMVRELSIATMQSKSFFEGMNLLKLNPEVIEKQMTKDAMGTIQRVLEKVNALPQDKRLSAMTMLFGKEFGDDAAKLANNLPELQRQLKLTAGNDALGSMQKESDINKDSLSAQWLLVKTGAQNTFSSLGETLRQPLMDILYTVKSVTGALRRWVEANPELTGTLMKASAVVAAVTVGLGTLAVALAAVLGPLAVIRLGFSVLGIKTLPSVTAAVTRTSSALSWLAGWRTTGTAATRACFIGQRRRFTYCAVVVFAPHGITDGKCPENCSRCAGCTFAVWIIRFTCCCCDVYESSGGTARWTGRRRHGAASTGIWSTGDAARYPVCHIWSVRCSAQSDRSCGYCTGGRGAGCLEILATHHRISRWRGGRIQSGGRSHQCSVRTA
ncbi:TP901 family phage tail tape measure protein [Escherichia coli]|nr:TP901 family phage tail tape measure protein [Escherichia coli]